MAAYTENADRYALLRMVDFRLAIVDLVSEFSDLPPGVASNVLASVSAEVLACAYLPQVPTPQAGEAE